MNNLELFFFFIVIIFLVLSVLISVAFFTLLERKVLGYIQIRKGPNKVSMRGVIQPINDAIKLFSKEFIFPYMSNFMLYFFMPMFSLFLSLFIWVIIPYLSNLLNFNWGVLFILCCLSLSVYLIMLMGWSSNSNYALLGSLRGVAQVISYEVSLALMFLSLVFLILDYNLMMFYLYQKKMWFICILFPLSLSFLSSMLAETNRSPFDFAEGESELVSGFNIEYGSGGFALIFLAEYSSILFLSMIFCVMFLGADIFNLIFFFKMIILGFIFIWVRGTLPRYRYDKLMYLAWKLYLPISLNYLMFLAGLIINIWN
uniref:NADH dehydrogenase subunit 1 n=1 Tax=Limnocentropus hysbald TaxID=1875661 RepID=UPI0022DCE226|nr:NADH dehydrogenase subunit 1 [Limnocentropus hysbald]UZZ44129.1 NADH dehydrogenase subunit 1 [Limnocentropus hysbald]